MTLEVMTTTLLAWKYAREIITRQSYAIRGSISWELTCRDVRMLCLGYLRACWASELSLCNEVRLCLSRCIDFFARSTLECDANALCQDL